MTYYHVLKNTSVGYYTRACIRVDTISLGFLLTKYTYTPIVAIIPTPLTAHPSTSHPWGLKYRRSSISTVPSSFRWKYSDEKCDVMSFAWIVHWFMKSLTCVWVLSTNDGDQSLAISPPSMTPFSGVHSIVSVEAWYSC